jgi:hypothetical protein
MIRTVALRGIYLGKVHVYLFVYLSAQSRQQPAAES